MINSLTESPEKVMAKNGKSFYFASMFFEPEQMKKIARLYQICRFVDDCADELHPERSREVLWQLRQELENPMLASDFQKAVSEVSQWGVRRQSLLELLTGAEFDQTLTQISDQKQFLQYCYWVAGVVGLMMCPLLGVRNKEAEVFAADLGIAMQITNICRDVLEDAQNNRVYLSREILETHGCQEIAKLPVDTPEPLRKVTAFYLELADRFYESAYKGLSYIPFRPRICIVLAGEIYRHIGVKIRDQGFNVLRGRVYLSGAEKVWVSLKCMRFLFRKDFWFPSRHHPISDFRLESV